MSYYTVYNNTTGDIVVSRSMSDDIVARRLVEHPEHSALNIKVNSISKKQVNLETLEVEDKAITVDVMDSLRTRRRHELIACDWTQGADSPLSDSKKTEWATYRQALRDLPSTTYTAIDDIVWPTKPE
jgi:hypothetical protein